MTNDETFSQMKLDLEATIATIGKTMGLAVQQKMRDDGVQLAMGVDSTNMVSTNEGEVSLKAVVMGDTQTGRQLDLATRRVLLNVLRAARRGSA